MCGKRWLIPAAGFLVLAALGGCSKGGKGPYATVSGVVTHNGVPVENAKVVFHSTAQVEGKPGFAASAQTDSSGKYLLAMVGNEPGIPPGMYKVTVVKLDAKAANLPKDFDEGQMMASGMARNLMPKSYENPNTTKLSVTLEEGKNENKNFDLKGEASTGSTIPAVP
jgi:hypothetical protein